MPHPRTPLAKAEVSGAKALNPARFANRKTPKKTRPLGEPYAAMTEAERGFWREYQAELPWLNSGHRQLVRMASRLSARLDADPDFGVSAMQTLSSILSKLGATPVDETKVTHGDDEEDDDEFFGDSRPN
jgi:hypothetical protein